MTFGFARKFISRLESFLPIDPKFGYIAQGVVTPIDSVQTPATGVKNWVKQSKPKIWKVKRSKAHRKLEKVKGQAP